MKTKEEHAEMRAKLMDGTLKAVSIYGLSGVTTRGITEIVGINEAYIYRYFLDKDDLLYRTFARTSQDILKKFSEFFKNVFATDGNFKERLRKFFDDSIRFLINDGDSSKFLIRYMYSPFFKGQALNDYRFNTLMMLGALEKFFKDGTDVKFIGHNMVMTLLSYSNEMINGTMEISDENIKKIFEMSYQSYECFLDWDKIKNLNKNEVTF